MKTSIFFLIFSGLFFFFQSCNNPTDQNSKKKHALKQKLVKKKKKKKKKKEAEENLPKILIDSLLINHLTGKCVYEKDTCFKVVPKHATTKTIYLQKETCDMFLKMKSAAEKDSVFLKINSGARNFNVQKYIWEKRWDGKKRLRDGSSAKKIKDLKERSLKLLLYTAMPGTSRHHWGTEIDLYHINGNKYYEKGKGLKEYNWLLKNAHKYGFHQVYSNKEKDHRTGYQEEKWHWSYMPISNQYHKKYKQLISYKDIYGFKGASTAKEIKAIENYVNGINKDYP